MSKKAVNLYYLADATLGGWATVLGHIRAILEERFFVRVYRITRATEGKLRFFGYGTHYQNISTRHIHAACKAAHGNLIVVCDNKHTGYLKKFPEGTGLIIHDPTELTATMKKEIGRFKIKTLRSGITEHMRQNGYDPQEIPMPFATNAAREKGEKKEGAVAMSRIDWDKHTDVIIEANKLGAGIEIYGKINRQYEYHTLEKLDPQWRRYYKGTFDREFAAVNAILARKRFMVDMSAIKNDGGGTQLTFMEAWDNGCVIILSADWFKYHKGEMQPGKNCLAVSSAQEIAQIVADKDCSYDEIIAAGYAGLPGHKRIQELMELGA